MRQKSEIRSESDLAPETRALGLKTGEEGEFKHQKRRRALEGRRAAYIYITYAMILICYSMFLVMRNAAMPTQESLSYGNWISSPVEALIGLLERIC